ncbi:MAG TPA: nucleotidyltransferase domain-containing protein [Acidimicrobiales bacterium]|nr:nucleotidyltransferase domain-containing protein [Acidimicrobiales bacterium]
MGGLEAVDARYQALWARIQEVLGDDPRVRSVVLSGSVADGTADAWSDLDVQVISQPEHHDALVADWPVWLAAITPTVFARTPLAPFIVNAVTAEGLTLDVSVWSGSAPTGPFAPTEYAVGQLSGQRFARVGDALEYAVAEQLRGLAGPFISLLRREEHVRHLTGVPHLLGLLVTVFLAETGAPPPGKHWNRTLTDEQRAVVAGLPPARATREDTVAWGLAVAELIVTRARPLYDRYGLTWPAELAAVAAARLRDQLGIETGKWLSPPAGGPATPSPR